MLEVGGGSGYHRGGNGIGIGGSGGGCKGRNGQYSPTWPSYYATGGTQTYGGIDNAEGTTRATFGKGGDFFTSYGGNGGGAGFYGGGGSSRGHSGAGGGSGYIGNKLLSNKHMACYNVETSNDEDTKTVSTTKASENPVEDYAKIGNGYAKITYVGE